MAMEFTLAAVGASALTEGIRFLYAQAGDVLKRWRERRDRREAAGEARPDSQVAVPQPVVLAGDLGPVSIDYAAVERLEDDLKLLRARLLEYIEGEPVDPADEQLVRSVDGLRRVMEAVWHQRITFQGEQRPPSGALAEGEVDVETVRGYVAGLRIGTMTRGHARGSVHATTVDEDAEAVGLDIDHLG
jgi:hypothetical protein